MAEMMNPTFEGAALLYQMMPGMMLPYEYEGVAREMRRKAPSWRSCGARPAPVK